jgi:hypothetical protein
VISLKPSLLPNTVWLIDPFDVSAKLQCLEEGWEAKFKAGESVDQSEAVL